MNLSAFSLTGQMKVFKKIIGFFSKKEPTPNDTLQSVEDNYSRIEILIEKELSNPYKDTTMMRSYVQQLKNLQATYDVLLKKERENDKK